MCTTQIIWVLAIRFDVYHPNHLGTCHSVWCLPPKPFGYFPFGLVPTTQIIWVLSFCLECTTQTIWVLSFGLVPTTQTIWVLANLFDVYHPNHLGGGAPIYFGRAEAPHKLPLRGMSRHPIDGDGGICYNDFINNERMILP